MASEVVKEHIRKLLDNRIDFSVNHYDDETIGIYVYNDTGTETELHLYNSHRIISDSEIVVTPDLTKVILHY